MCPRFADYGCMLEIHSLELLPDGRSYVDTVGGSRFRVLKRGQRDGYHTADIEYLEDLKVRVSEVTNSTNICGVYMLKYCYSTGQLMYRTSSFFVFSLSQVDGSEMEELQGLHDSVYQQAQDWYQRLGSRIREQIDRQYGTMPDMEGNIQVGALISQASQSLPLCLKYLNRFTLLASTVGFITVWNENELAEVAIGHT